MSKGTIRLPASAITDGRIGTARIREQIAGAAAQLASTDMTPLDAAMRAIASGTGLRVKDASEAWQSVSYASVRTLSPVERTQQLGRLPVGRMNKTEIAYAEVLELRRAAGEILDFEFESVKLRLADRTWYTPDFWLHMADGCIEVHEVKGRWQDDARVKFKVAAELFPRYRFIAVQRDARHGWRTEELTSRKLRSERP